MAVGAAAAVGLGLFTILLWPEWASNPDLSHGFFALPVFALLVWESRRHQPPRWLPRRPWRGALLALALAVAVGLFGIAGLLAASVTWTHAVVKFVLAAALASYLLAALTVLSAEEVRAVPLNWISVTAIFLWILVAPIPHGTYARLTMSLQASVTDGVLHALHLLGVPARQRGNVIDLALTSVGVEEACSGIRSLLSCLYAGFFFAAWQLRGAWSRAALIVIAPLLAVTMNFIRSLSLTLMANAGIDIGGFWHDATGFAILGVTAAVLALLAVALAPQTVQAVRLPAPGTPPRRLAAGFWSGTVVVGLVAIFFWSQTRPAVGASGPPPNLAALLPAAPAGWEVHTTGDLYRFSGVLQTESLFERTYLKRSGGRTIEFTAYVAYWRAGQAPVSLVASHTPDACWPGAGWIKTTDRNPQVRLQVGGRTLATAEYRTFVNSARYPQHVWFWHIHDGRVINYQDPYSVPALLRLALRYGFRREGDQFFIRLSSNQPWETLAHEPLLAEIAAHLAPYGF